MTSALTPQERREQTLVLAWPGALARYGLSDALGRIVDGAERGDAPAILLVVPSHAGGTAPSINGRLPVPAPLPSQRLVMPDAWPDADAIGQQPAGLLPWGTNLVLLTKLKKREARLAYAAAALSGRPARYVATVEGV